MKERDKTRKDQENTRKHLQEQSKKNKKKTEPRNHIGLDGAVCSLMFSNKLLRLSQNI